MTEKKQHKVGERFEMCKLIYEVRESASCEGCALFIEEEDHCTDGHGDKFEPCSNINRDDRKSVIFVQVGESKSIKSSMKQEKKPTNAQLKSKIDNALVFVEKTKNTRQAFFFDKMCIIAANEKYAIIKTGYHRHVFDALNPNQGGYARPYIYTLKVLDIVDKHKASCWDDKQQGFSYEALLGHLEKQEDKSEYYLVYFYSMWLYIIFHNLYSLDVSQQSTFLVYFKYLEMIATNHVIASVVGPHEEDITNKDFVDKYIEILKELSSEMQERIIFDKIDEDATLREEISALEAADKYLLYEHDSPLNTTTHKADVSTEMQYHKDIINAFKAGAIWQEEQDNICYEEIFEEGAAWKAQEASEWLADNADYYGDDTKALQIDFDRAMAIENKKED